MFLNDLIQRRLVSLLQPWLRDEVELNVQLGFLHSHADLENLTFNTSALNDLLDDPTRLCFKEVTVQRLTLSVSNWSAPAFDFQVHGLNIVLSVGEEEDDGVRRRPKPRDSSIEEREKILAELDPEGSALHNTIRRISEITAGSWTTHLFDWILQQCRLQVHDAHFLVQSPLSSDLLSLSFEMKELGVQCKHIKGCLLSGLVNSIFLPYGENPFDLDVQNVEISLRRGNHISCIFLSTDSTKLLASAKIKHLQFRELNFYAVALNFSLSPSDISIILLLFALWSKESNRSRTGKQLWEIAATNTTSLNSSPKFAFHKIASTICLWLRYVNAYKKMLILVGYPVHDAIKKFTNEAVQNEAYSRTLKQQLEVISVIEKELPVEAIVQARRIIRYRAASSGQQSKDGGHRSKLSMIWWKICQSLSLIWMVICSVLHSVKSLLPLKKMLVRNQDICHKLGIINEDHIPGVHICLYVGDFSISISPDNEVSPSFSRKLVLDVGHSYPGLLTFCLSVDFFCLRCSKDVSEQYFSFACGCLKVVSSLMEDKANKFNNNFKGRPRKNIHNLQPTLWGEPYHVLYFTESGGANSHDTGGDFVHTQNSLIERACLNWRTFSSGFVESEIQNMKNPFILCEIKGFLTDRSLKNLTVGYTTCCMVMGRLNLVLEYLVIVSVTVICRQVSVISWATSRMGTTVLQGDSRLVEDPPVADWNNKYKSVCAEIKVMVPRMLPEKHMQIAIHITGAQTKLLLRKEDFHGENADLYHKLGNDAVHLSFDVDDIELSVSPSLESDLTSSSGDTAVFDAKSLKDLLSIDIAKSDSVYSSRTCTSLSAYLKLKGLNVSLDTRDNQSCQIVVLSSSTIRLLSLRKDLHSLGSVDIFFSIVLHSIGCGLTTWVFMDEFEVLRKVISGLLCTVFQVFSTSSSGLSRSCEDLLRRESTDSESERALKNRITQVASVLTDTTFNVSTTCEISSVKMIIYDSRKEYNAQNSMSDANTIADKKSTVQPIHVYGINISVAHSFIRLSFEEEKADILIGFSEFESGISQYLDAILDTSDQVEPQLPVWSHNSLYQASLSHCEISLCLRALGNNILQASQRNVLNGSDSRHEASMSLNHSPSLINDVNPSFDWLCISISLAEVYLVKCAVKNLLLLQGNELNTLEASLSVGGQFQTISCQSQGGSIIVDIAALVKMVECYAFYFNQLRGLWPAVTEHLVVQNDEDTSLRRSSSYQQLEQHKLVNWDQVEAFAVNLSRVSLALVDGDQSGELQKLQLEGNGNLELELPRKFSFRITNLSVLSQLLHISTEQQSQELSTPFFSSLESNDQSSIVVHDDTLVSPDHLSEVNSIRDEASRSSPQELGNQYHADGSRKPWGGTSSQISLATPQNYVLKDLNASLVVEQPLNSSGSTPLQSNDFWIGNCSIDGCDMTLSLREIQIILFAGEALSAVFSVEGTKSIEQQTHQKNSGESTRSQDEMVPDGTIVSIKDIDQHMYVAVDRVESGYNLVGAIHYSLFGERALFRVKYHQTRRWNSQVQYLSFISLYAKDELGEPLRLNCHRQSDFVDISSSSDSAWALWRALPYKHDIYDADVDLKTYLPQTKNVFYLVNKKNDCAAAFVNGFLEVVRKPGHPFKFKVFRDPSPYVNSVFLDGCLEREPGTILLHDTCISEGKDLSQRGSSFGITVAVDKVSLTIDYELSDSKEKVPLLQGSISFTDSYIQVSNTKVRAMSRLAVLLSYFDSQKDMWRDLMHPLEIDVFYRYTFLNQGPKNSILWVPGHFYARIKELSMTITELSLDIILFIIGKLNLAGPYAVKDSTILANCCKVENQSGLTLVCQFYDNQDVSVAGRQATTIFLRHMALANRPPEASFFSIQLIERGLLSTSLLHLSLLETQSFAWRPRIVSLQESKTYPGPFLVAEVSPGTEDYLSIGVSPLLRIHNNTKFPMELRFQRPQHKEIDYASVRLEAGDTIDDSMTAFSAINLSGGRKKTLNSLSVGNFLLSFRPEVTDVLTNFENPSACWSDDLRGGKPVRLSGIFDKLTYQVRKAFSFQPIKYSLSTAHCAIVSEDRRVANIHFLVESIGKDVPIIYPDNFGYVRADKNSPVSLQEQKEIFLLPTVRFTNFLDMEIHVKLNDTGPPSTNSVDCVCNEATIHSGSAVNLYANPAAIYFTITLTSFGTSCKPINSSDSARRLQKRKTKVQFLDIELDFDNGKYFALLRLSRGLRGILEAAVFTSYTLENNTEFSLFCFPANHKLVSRHAGENIASQVSPELGSYLPPRSIKSWLSKCHKVHITLLDERASKAPLNLDVLSGLTGLNLEVEGEYGSKTVTKLGVSLKPFASKAVPLQVVSMHPRYVILNESDEIITVRQCFVEEDGTDTVVTLNSKQRTALTLRSRNEITTMKRNPFLQNFLKKHAKPHNDSSFFVQFQPNKANFSWSGPVCIASLGRFFLKFKKSSDSVQQSDLATQHNSDICEFATVHVVEDGPTIVLRFCWPANIDLPYRIENHLENTSITYYQKGLPEPEVLASGSIAGYVWDDLRLDHKLIVQIDALHLQREINLDKVREWKPFYRIKQQRGLGLHLPLEKKPEDPKKNWFRQLTGLEINKLGFEVYAEGLTRVLRICEFSDRRRGDTSFHSCTKMQLRISCFAIQLLERAKQDVVDKDKSNALIYNPIILARLNRIDFDAVFAEKHKLNHLRVQSLSVEPKWIGAPFASMLRRHHVENIDTNDRVLRVGLVLAASSSSVKHVQHLSIVLQPLDFNLDEETLMRIVPFWRTSLRDTNTPSQKYYIDHFEIHPVKVVASFLPGESYANHSSTQETLRSLLHSVIKIPPVKNMTVELNGILVTHALVTLRELSIKCAQHYSWYAMRAVYIAKGSPLLPPAFASIFDDLASSSLDVFFDPSTGHLNLPGLTIGTFKLIRKCIDGKEFSGTKRYFGDLGKTFKSAGSNILFAAVTEISDSVLKGAEASGLNGMVNGFHQGILKLAMEPTLLGSAFMEGGPDRKIGLDRSPGVDELYIEGYLQAMLDTLYKQEYLRVRVIDNQVILKNLPPSSSLIEEIVERVKGFLVSKTLLKGDTSTAARPLRHMRGEREWRVVPTVLTLCEHLFVSFAIRMLRKQAGIAVGKMNWKQKVEGDDEKAIVPASGQKLDFLWKWGFGNFVLSGILAYVDGRLCRYISNPIARRIVSGFLLSFLERNE